MISRARVRAKIRNNTHIALARKSARVRQKSASGRSAVTSAVRTHDDRFTSRESLNHAHAESVCLKVFWSGSSFAQPRRKNIRRHTTVVPQSRNGPRPFGGIRSSRENSFDLENRVRYCFPAYARPTPLSGFCFCFLFSRCVRRRAFIEKCDSAIDFWKCF